MDKIDLDALRFLLKLLGYPNYRAPLSKVTPNSKATIAERERICRNLRKEELVDCSYEITKLKIAPPGRALLKLDPSGLPSQELKVLRASEKEKVTPGKTGIVAAQRQEIIQGLADQGLIELETKIKEVWISEAGQKYLRHEYTAKGKNLVLSLDMLANYLQFLRQSFVVQPDEALPTPFASINPPNDKEILQMIRDLDQQLGTENYLPIFHLRQKLQPPLSPEELDRALYRLQSENQIELSTLAEPEKCTPEEVNAGIPQRRGGLLFFITVN